MTATSVEGNGPHATTEVGAAFAKFLATPWPLPDWQMSERRRLWLAFDSGAQWAIDSIRAAVPLRQALPTDETVTGEQR